MNNMNKRKNVITENYLDKIPSHPEHLVWKTNTDGIVTLKIENTGWANRIAQTIFGRPRFSYVHLDKFGSFIWSLIDGTKSITDLGKLVDAEFGEKAYPLYERLVHYFKILDSYHFIQWVKTE